LSLKRIEVDGTRINTRIMQVFIQPSSLKHVSNGAEARLKLIFLGEISSKAI